MIASALISLVLLAEPVIEMAEEPKISEPGLNEHGTGGAMAPAAMPRGSTALYAILGAPDVGGGYRQGFEILEFEARVLFNYLELSVLLEPGVRIPVLHRGIFQLAPTVALGFVANSGSRYFDKANFGYLALRPRAGAVGSLAVTETLHVLVQLDVPWAIPLTNRSAGGQFTPTVGAGIELHLGGRVSGLLLGQIGLDVIKEPLGVTQLRPAWAVRLGLGYRLF